MLSDTARAALAAAYATKGAHRGQLLANCPNASKKPLAAAAWHAVMIVVNPYRASVFAVMLMTDEQRAVRDEIIAHVERMPKAYQIMMQRDREALESLGVF